MKALGSTEELRSKLDHLSKIEVCGTSGGAVKCVDIGGNTVGESGTLGLN